jgi:membrane protein
MPGSLGRNADAVSLVRDTVNAWLDDYAPSMGAALAYYTMFSIAPLLLILITVAGFFFGADAVRGEIIGQLRGLMGEDGAHAIEGLLASAHRPANSAMAAIIGGALLVIGATTIFAELQNALDRIWRAPAAKHKSGIFELIRARALSFGLVLGIAFLLIVSLVISAGLSAFAKWWSPIFGAWETLAYLIDFIVSSGLMTLMFAMIYKIIPRASVHWPDVWIGAAATALLFALGKFLIGLYIGKTGIASGFGAAASLVVLLVWVYYSAQIFLLGAEFTWVYAHCLGSRKHEPQPLPADPFPSRATKQA